MLRVVFASLVIDKCGTAVNDEKPRRKGNNSSSLAPADGSRGAPASVLGYRGWCSQGEVCGRTFPSAVRETSLYNTSTSHRSERNHCWSLTQLSHVTARQPGRPRSLSLSLPHTLQFVPLTHGASPPFCTNYIAEPPTVRGYSTSVRHRIM